MATPANAPQAPQNGHSGMTIDVGKLPPDLAIMVVENDTIRSLAHSAPRDLEAVKNRVLAQIKVFPKIAEDLIYCKPVGTDDDGVMQYARELSIRGAEILATEYGYNRVASKVSPIDEMHAQLEATFVDYQTGRIWSVSNVVSRAYKRRGGGTGVVPEDRFYNLTVKAEVSKVIREAILRCVPPGLKQAIFEAADKEISSLLSPAKMDEIVASFASKGVRPEQLEALIGRTRKQGWIAADRQKLAGIWAALKNEETTVGEIFGVEPGAKPANGTGQPPASGTTNGSGTATSGAVTGDDLANPKGGAEEKTHKDAPGVAPGASKVEPAQESNKPATTQAAQTEAAEGPVEREPGEDDPIGPDEAREIYEDDILRDLEERLRAETGIIPARRMGEELWKSPTSTLSPGAKAKAKELAEARENEIRATRGGRGNKADARQGNLV